LLRLGYTLLMHLAMPLILIRLWIRGRSESGYRKFIGERFGGADQGSQSNEIEEGAIWVHAVSVGEVRAAVPLIAALRATWPEARVVLTCMTPTGRRTALDLFSSNVTVCFLPYDLPWALARFVARWRPMMLVIMETELWPNLLAICASRKIPAFLANARLSEKSRLGYAKFAPLRALATQAFGRFHTVLAQSEADATRLKSLGARHVVVTGNLKFDLNVVAETVALGEQWRAPFSQSGRPVLLLASTREHEEMALVDAYRQVFAEALSAASATHAARPLLVVVPRHPSRFDDVAERIAHTGLTVARRSGAAPPPRDIDVWLGDSMGELQAYYAMCDLAIIGGSFQPLGGQNLIEAAALGKPVIMGPSTFNFADAVRLALAAEAMRSVEDAAGALTAAQRLLADMPTRLRMGENARHFASAHRGATAKTVAIIQGAVAEKTKP
jgi:3-deoxy-D-manno-octulosonic-acid transferase